MFLQVSQGQSGNRRRRSRHLKSRVGRIAVAGQAPHGVHLLQVEQQVGKLGHGNLREGRKAVDGKVVGLAQGFEHTLLLRRIDREELWLGRGSPLRRLPAQLFHHILCRSHQYGLVVANQTVAAR